MPRAGFLGTAAPWSTDLTLVLEGGMGVGLLLGALLARRRWYRAHAFVQSAIVLANLGLIALTMVPPFRERLVPAIPARLGRPYVLIAVVHGALGALTEILGLYVLLVAGTRLVPEALRFSRYRPWMRAVLVSWWVVLLLGLATYVRWYVRG